MREFENINSLCKLKPNYIGFIFWAPSERYVTDKTPKIDDSIKKTGVFVNASIDYIETMIVKHQLSAVQLHGDETPDFCNQFDVPILKALRIKNEASLSVMDQYDVAVFLLDTFSNDQYGGTGETFDWSVLNRKFKTPIILSGGLNSENILYAIDAVNPSAVDVNSGVESSPGKKDFNKLKSLFKNLNKTQSTGFQFG